MKRIKTRSKAHVKEAAAHYNILDFYCQVFMFWCFLLMQKIAEIVEQV
jgi:hypothetical protein